MCIRDSIKAVLNERQVELAYEGKRSWDLKRWLLFEGGAGFDPNIGGGYDAATGKYDPIASWGAGWKIYDGKNGRPEYSRTNNVLTKLGLTPLSGTKHTSKIWGYDLDNVHAVEEYIGTEINHPLLDNVSVSYTHLDVYKRQSKHSVLCIPLCSLSPK